MEEKQKEFDKYIKKLVYSNLLTLVASILIFACTNYFLYKALSGSLNKYAILLEIVIYLLASVIIGLVVRKILNISKKKLNEYRNYNIVNLAKEGIVYFKDEYNAVAEGRNSNDEYFKNYYEKTIGELDKIIQYEKSGKRCYLAAVLRHFPTFKVKEMVHNSNIIKMNKIRTYTSYNSFILISSYGLAISIILSLILNFACNNYIASIVCSSLDIIFCSVIASSIGRTDIKICKHCGAIDMVYQSKINHYETNELKENVHDVYGTVNLYDRSGNKLASAQTKVGTQSTFQEVNQSHFDTEYSCLCCGQLLYTDYKTYTN